MAINNEYTRALVLFRWSSIHNALMDRMEFTFIVSLFQLWIPQIWFQWRFFEVKWWKECFKKQWFITWYQRLIHYRGFRYSVGGSGGILTRAMSYYIKHLKALFSISLIIKTLSSQSLSFYPVPWLILVLQTEAHLDNHSDIECCPDLHFLAFTLFPLKCQCS